MTKTELEKLYQLTGEVADLEKRINRLKIKSRDYVGDTVRDYRSGEGIPLTIYGYSEGSYRKLEKLLQRYEEKKNVLLNETIRIENELDSIEDGAIRRIIRLRYFDRMAWDEVALVIDKTKTGDAMRKKLETFFKNSANSVFGSVI